MKHKAFVQQRLGVTVSAEALLDLVPSGGYDPIATAVFSCSRFQRFLLEQDDAR